MLVIAVIGGFGMGTSIDWYVEAQRIQSAQTVRDASYGLWAGGAVTLIRNGFWAASILAFFVHAARTSPTRPTTSWAGSGWASSCCRPGWSASSSARSWRSTSRRSRSHLNLGALYFTRDLYQRYLKPEAVSEKRWSGSAARRRFVLLIGSFFYGLMMEEITAG